MKKFRNFKMYNCFTICIAISFVLGIFIFNGCNKKDTEPTPDPTPAFTGNVIVLQDSTDLSNITSYSYSSGVVGFSNAVDHSVGDIIVAGISNQTPDGFLRKITSISNDKKTIQTTQAALEEPVENGYLEFQKQLSPSDLRMGPGKSLKGVELVENPVYDFSYQLTNVVLYDADGNMSTTTDQILANGFVNFNDLFDIKLNIQNRKLNYFLFQNTVTDNSQIEISSKTSVSNIYEVKTIWSKKFKAILIGFIPLPPPLPPIPVYVTPQIEVNVGIDGNVSVSTTSVMQTASFTAGVSYENNQWNNLSSFTNSFSFNTPQLSTDISLKGYAGPRLNLLVYGIAGPSAEVDAFLRLNASGSPSLSWYLYGGLEVKVGAKIEAFSKTLFDYSATVIKDSTIIAQGSGGPITSTMTDPRDGQVYNTVKIGNQWWMAENLNIGTMITSDQTNNATLEKYCYGNNTANCNTYGGLYQWDEMMQYNPSDAGTVGTTQGICPNGWHLPTHHEWTTLERAICTSSTCATDFPYDFTTTGYRGTDGACKLKETGTTHWNSLNPCATNESGFTALPGGYRHYIDGSFSSLGAACTYWMATESNSTNAWRRSLFYSTSNVLRTTNGLNNKQYGQSCRCIKD